MSAMAKHYGKQTKLAMENFPISGWTVPFELLHALALIKEHAAIVNGELGEIPGGHAKAIARAAREVKDQKHHDQFPVDVFQTGSGTSTNMNMNEVLASLASTAKRKVHPNDHVNRCQSSNDTIPSAIQIGAAMKVQYDLLPVLAQLRKDLTKKAREFRYVIKTARTHLMDAVPMYLGDEFAGYAALIAHSEQTLKEVLPKLCVLPLGGTAAGTGLNAHPRFTVRVYPRLKKETQLPLLEAPNHVAAQSCPLALLSLSSALRELATALTKIANDIRHMSSGPVAGLQELQLPTLQPGSSIMPGKVNPVLCESVLQVSMYVEGADATVQAGVKQGSQYELNTAYPVIAQSLFMSMRLITTVSEIFGEQYIRAVDANDHVLRAYTERNPMLVTALAPMIGYDAAAKIAKEAIEQEEPIVDVAMRHTGMPERKLRKLLDPKKMV